MRSELRQVAADAGSFTKIKRLVSSANKRIFEPLSMTMSLMYSRNSKGPKIEYMYLNHYQLLCR